MDHGRHPAGAARSRADSARRLSQTGTGNDALGRLAELTALLLGAESAQVSVISETQAVVAGTGDAAGGVGLDSPAPDSLCTVTMAEGRPLVVNDAGSDLRVSLLPPVASGTVGAYLGVPLVAADNHTVGALCVFTPHSRTWTDAEVALLQQLAAPVLAELELAALSREYDTERLAWQVAVDAARIGAWDLDLVTGELRWDDRLLELFGLDHETFTGTIEAFNAAVHPADLADVSRSLDHAIDTCGDYAAEYRIVLPGGEVRWIAARGRAVAGPSGRAVRIAGAAFDTTAEQDAETRVSRVLEAMPTAFFHLDTSWRFTYANPVATRLLGFTKEELLASSLWELFPAANDSVFEANYRQAVATGEPLSFDAYYPPPLDGWYEVRAWPTPDGLSVYFLDVTQRHEAAEVLALAARRSALLVAVSETLNDTLDAEETLARLAALVVPQLGEWCLVSLVDDAPGGARRRIRDVGAAHADPTRQHVIERYAEVRAGALLEGSFVQQALDTQHLVEIAGRGVEEFVSLLEPGEARDLCRQLDPGHGYVVPLPGRGGVAGLMTLFRAAGRPAFSREDQELVVEIASRAGLALDNARLYTEQRDLAEGLQRSLLTEPPPSEAAEIVVRYEPASRAAQVGGDWYDAFQQRDGSTVVVIGDVVGHDTAAAATMGQIRSLLRGIAVHTGDGPAAVLEGVDRVMETLRVEATATAVVARLERPADVATADTTRLCWSNAGHPAPVLIGPDGSVGALDAAQPDLLLGFDPAVGRQESAVVLPPGSTVLLFTDGLVERRDRTADLGALHLHEVIAALVAQDLGLDELCDAVLAGMLPTRPDDDVALVGVRLRGPVRTPVPTPAPKPGPAPAGTTA